MKAIILWLVSLVLASSLPTADAATVGMPGCERDNLRVTCGFDECAAGASPLSGWAFECTLGASSDALGVAESCTVTVHAARCTGNADAQATPEVLDCRMDQGGGIPLRTTECGVRSPAGPEDAEPMQRCGFYTRPDRVACHGIIAT